MKINIGRKDKLIRVAIAFAIGLLGVTGVIDGKLESILLVVAVIIAATALFNFCPLYRIFGFSTTSKSQ